MRRWLLVLCVAVLAVATAWAQEELPANLAIDEALPSITGVDLSGNPVDLGSILGKKTLVLSFWSIYCSDCVRELDDLRTIRQDYPAEEVEIVAINTDSGLPISRIASFVRRYEGARGTPLNVFHLLDRDLSVVNGLGVRYIPLMVMVRKSGEVASIISGYRHDQDRDRLAQALEQGRVALGAWSEGLRRRLHTVLRGAGPTGAPVEFASFRVEEGMNLFGWYDAKGWLADASSRPNREAEAKRVEQVVQDRLKMVLLEDVLASVGVRFPVVRTGPFQVRGIEIPGSALEADDRWSRIFKDLEFDQMYMVQSEVRHWFGDEHWAGMVAEVDMGRFRTRLADLNLLDEPTRIRLTVVSDFDFKPRVTLKTLQESSYRVVGFREDSVLYIGTAEQLSRELSELNLAGLEIFTEVTEGGGVRIEVY